MIGRWRSSVQTFSILALVVIPILNYYDFTFFQGWFQSIAFGGLWIVSPLEGLECILVSRSFYAPLLWGMLIPILLSILLGHVFCSWVCPVNTLQVWTDRLLKPWLKHRNNRFPIPRALLWYVLAAELILAVVLGKPLFVFLSPPGLVGREIMTIIFFRTVAVEGLLLLAILTANLISRRMFCRSFCPLRGVLALLGSKRRLVVTRVEGAGPGCRRCDKSCPLGLQPSIGESESIYCWNCGRCVDACNDGDLKMIWKRSSQKPQDSCLGDEKILR